MKGFPSPARTGTMKRLQALHRDLTDFRTQHPEVTLLQYVDDLLLAAPTKEACILGTRHLLRELGEKGYRASAKKAQICQTKVTYLGYILSEGKRWLTPGRIETVACIPPPQNPREVREFLGTAGFCRLWIPGFAELAAPLYALTKESAPFTWQEKHQSAFEALKEALLSAPALGLPDTSKPFTLFIDEKQGIAKGVLTQKLGPWKRPVAYLSKKLDPVAAGWPPCLRIMAATAMLVKDSAKLTLGQPLTVITLHALEAVVRQPPDRWITNARLTHYQALLLDTDRIQFGPPVTLNPATLLPAPEDQQSAHDCRQVLAETHGTREDLKDQELPDADHSWYTDGSSYIDSGTRRAG
uniref:Reverse transcriptase domain-containing protein n=1 Tax=Felis catus TaxID=9685 RepID=A0ABI7Y564_FELCA